MLTNDGLARPVRSIRRLIVIAELAVWDRATVAAHWWKRRMAIFEGGAGGLRC